MPELKETENAVERRRAKLQDGEGVLARGECLDHINQRLEATSRRLFHLPPPAARLPDCWVCKHRHE